MEFSKFGFQVGLGRSLEVREEIIQQSLMPCRIAYVSDIHLRRGRSARLSEQVVDALDRALPDLILLGGDLVDQVSELESLQRLVSRISEIAPVFAIPGNHDISVGESLVCKSVESAGGCWLANRTVDFFHGGRAFGLSGSGAGPSPRGDFNVMCAHNPSVWKSAKIAGFDLVLAGHLHGCQGVLFEAGGRLYPGAFFYPYNFIRQFTKESCLVVSMGCSDLIPLRWNCPREIILCIV